MENLNEIQQSTLEQLPFGNYQHNLSDIPPTASDIGHLWTGYMAETMSVCMLKHITEQTKDPDIKPILQQALDLSTERVKSMENLYTSIHHPIPIGFGEKDVDASAPGLFSEAFGLIYTRLMSLYVVEHYLLALTRSPRSDFRQIYLNAITSSSNLIEKTTNVLLAKGLLPKSPIIVVPDQLKLVDDKNYYGSIFGGKRTLNAVEISHLYHCIVIKMVFSTLNLGFAQVTKSKDIKKYFERGKQIDSEHTKILGSILQEENLTIPMPGEFQVSDSKHSPYSEKLMLFHSTVVTSYSTLSDAFALTSSARKDLVTAFSRLSIESLEYAKHGADLLIENNWLERIPETVNRKELIH
ncbi:Protein of unknown function (DUF3231) [Desulfosporosinus acidiphilus SJ4]|uniref:DUF3231 family protein n=1 Tax=Desulfosporosinus acidiphilus (strain DSM 22704 / JCM 16185 / SJ4) TaxID=646529 RepID=I4D1M7_DESAJ|nr:DUF3231 family protein [Desulfosporosinus acidiphilus]AFM39701.1 Protein of unknown function (DUF3231) [Desulfosporosinus acidiphilus SJ4]